MTHFHAVMIDETGCEFGASVEAESRDAAYDYLQDNYPESRVAQLESPEDTAKRQQRIYDDALAGIDYDEDGRPIYMNPPEWDDDDFEDDDDWEELDEDELAERCLN
jgi:hypothetical protein